MLFEVLGGAGSYTLGRRDPEEAVPQAALEDGSSGRAGAGRGTSGASGTVSLGSGRFCPRWRLRHIKKLRIGRFGAPGPPPKGSSPQARFVPPSGGLFFDTMAPCAALARRTTHGGGVSADDAAMMPHVTDHTEDHGDGSQGGEQNSSKER